MQPITIAVIIPISDFRLDALRFVTFAVHLPLKINTLWCLSRGNTVCGRLVVLMRSRMTELSICKPIIRQQVQIRMEWVTSDNRFSIVKGA